MRGIVDITPFSVAESRKKQKIKINPKHQFENIINITKINGSAALNIALLLATKSKLSVAIFICDRNHSPSCKNYIFKDRPKQTKIKNVKHQEDHTRYIGI